jgi:hypothetical protein
VHHRLLLMRASSRNADDLLVRDVPNGLVETTPGPLIHLGKDPHASSTILSSLSQPFIGAAKAAPYFPRYDCQCHLSTSA